MENFEKFCESVYQLSHFKEDDAAAFVKGAIYCAPRNLAELYAFLIIRCEELYRDTSIKDGKGHNVPNATKFGSLIREVLADKTTLDALTKNGLPDAVNNMVLIGTLYFKKRKNQDSQITVGEQAIINAYNTLSNQEKKAILNDVKTRRKNSIDNKKENHLKNFIKSFISKK